MEIQKSRELSNQHIHQQIKQQFTSQLQNIQRSEKYLVQNFK